MVNKVKGEIGFEADGKSYKMRLGINEICELETVTGLGLSEIQAHFQNPTASIMRATLWAALKGGGHNMTLNEVGDLLESISFATALEHIGAAFAASFPDAEKSNSKNPTKARRNGTGKAS